jgi:hypothetical protein
MDTYRKTRGTWNKIYYVAYTTPISFIGLFNNETNDVSGFRLIMIFEK